MHEAPCVVVNVQRAGPSTGLPHGRPGYDAGQMRSHGHYDIIALPPRHPPGNFCQTILALI
jgi:2-oxoglutarate ferredoxin oxidoreductase subunit alpha